MSSFSRETGDCDGIEDRERTWGLADLKYESHAVEGMDLNKKCYRLSQFHLPMLI